LESLSFQELEALVNVEAFQNVILEQIFKASAYLRPVFVDFYSQLVTQFWLENSCFELKVK
jgi:hypothetical protein